MPLKPTTDPSSLSFPDEEVKTLAFWEEIDAFQTALKLSEGKPEYTFYDGPPFATGTPHYGHILAGTIKDTMTRYAHQNGFHVPRRFGWDCHGLPIEFEIDKQEGIKTRDDVLAIGIDKYNEMCRSIVMRFSAEWKTTVTRLGRWIDMENDYKTMDTNYMESVWWAFKTMFDKGYVYRGFKVMPYSTACGTPLSNFEAGMNYKDVNDPEVYVTFPLVDEPDVNLVAWTTTPWTLPSNLALCVNPEMDYVKIKDKKTEKIYIVAKARVTEGFYTVKKGAALPYDVLDEFKGAGLEGKAYQPLFDYFVEQFQPQGAFKVVCDPYVTSTSGTGIVHQAPAFGEDDNRVCVRYGIIIKGGEIPCPLDANGRFTAPVEDFKGEYIKDADKGIMAHLKKVGRLYKSGTIFHSYPFCWRSDTPLIYRAIPSWFVRVESIRERLIANNDSTYWVPSFVKDNRFKNWLADARDWAVSRNRFWGTPLPIWANDDYTEIVAIGSIDELEQLSGVRVTDLHRHNIDHITIPSKSGEGVLRRTPEIFDCWLESGCMPYAQLHYPFENKERFEAGFPADFIAEGIDQTRGWFYTLMVISTILFDRPPFKNVIVNGIVLNKEGKKMSKREKNYPDPNLVINSYGSDSLRLYLVNSPVVRGDDLKFDEAGVRAISRDVLRLWYSSYHFLVQSILQHESRTGSEFTPNLALSLESGNLMDKWILANLQSLIAFVDVELKAYHLYTVVPRLVAFLEELNNWYIKLNRPRLRGKNGEGECLGAVNALYEVLMTMCKAMAPFVPFITEHIYQNLRLCLPEDQRLQSVHFTSYPQPNELLVDKNMVENFKNLQAVINLGRTARERRTMPLRLPLKEVTIIHKSQEVVDNLQILVKYIEEGLSVSKVNLTTLEAEYVSYSISLNQRAVGKRLRAEKAKVEAAVKQLTQDQIRAYAVEPRIELEGHVLEGEDLIAVKVFNGNKEIMEADWDANFLIVLNLTVDRDQQMQCLARGTKNRVQRFRKKAGIKVGDDIVVYHQAKEDSELSVAINELSGFIQSEIGVPFLPFSQVPADATLSEPEVGEVEDIPLTLWIHKK